MVSHISRKTSEMWGTRPWRGIERQPSIPFDWLRGPDLLRGGAPDYLDEIVQPYLAGEGGLHLIGGELKVLLRCHDGLIQGKANHGPAQQTLGYAFFA